MLHSPPQRRVRGGALGPSPALPLPPTGTREAAFVYAISSAGVAFAVTRACSSGELEKCGCDRTVHGVSPQGECGRWEGREWQAGDLGPALTHSGHGAPHPSPPTGFQWSGCSDNIAYGVAFSQSFVDVRERSKGASSSRALMNLHNNEAGRKVVWHFPWHRHRQGRAGWAGPRHTLPPVRHVGTPVQAPPSPALPVARRVEKRLVSRWHRAMCGPRHAQPRVYVHAHTPPKQRGQEVSLASMHRSRAFRTPTLHALPHPATHHSRFPMTTPSEMFLLHQRQVPQGQGQCLQLTATQLTGPPQYTTGA